MELLLREASETGENTLKRSLGPLSLTALGVGAVIGAGIFVMTGLGATTPARRLRSPSFFPASDAFSRACATPSSPR